MDVLDYEIQFFLFPEGDHCIALSGHPWWSEINKYKSKCSIRTTNRLFQSPAFMCFVKCWD